jgi:hypothetical protein
MQTFEERKQFFNTIKLTPDQRREVESYLGDFTVMTEIGFLKLVRKIKQIEQQISEMKYK